VQVGGRHGNQCPPGGSWRSKPKRPNVILHSDALPAVPVIGAMTRSPACPKRTVRSTIVMRYGKGVDSSAILLRWLTDPAAMTSTARTL
jgi:hypothetical protein